ncbi:MAG: hypothetical protein VW683_02725 [Betaproteobacteria bacterium]
MKQNHVNLVKTWDRKTINKQIKDLTFMIMDRKRDGVDHSRFSNDLHVLLTELANR